MTVNEIKEILVHLYAYAGFPRSLNGINTFMALLNERQARGIEDEGDVPGRDGHVEERRGGDGPPVRRSSRALPTGLKACDTPDFLDYTTSGKGIKERKEREKERRTIFVPEMIFGEENFYIPLLSYNQIIKCFKTYT